MEIINIVVLSLSGLLLIYAGTMRLIKPIKSLCLKIYLDDPEIKLEGKVDIFNEMRGAGSSYSIKWNNYFTWHNNASANTGFICCCNPYFSWLCIWQVSQHKIRW